MRPGLVVSLAVVVGLAPAGCSVFAPGDDVCTLAGCQTGLAVELTARPAGPFRVEVTTPGTLPGGAAYVFDCPDAARCPAVVFFADFTPARVSVRVVTPTGAVTREFTPAYRTHRPNGPDCPPECRAATVRVDLPA